ncbi:MAG TPA: accessory factor UbiK family protein [Ferrovibrio sp.]|jgi:BMFP domain-containing protein YqiC|uniref:accessory factor UbiK family protein n=1 Tax=Ferrovibrio sp. TaxID=1917215 RepID=UPI002B4B2D60|nr:accessory factor UbiK family protein [Ferrovibrio sp.]HLT76052.1 accessory factor UbiK family protein [Ferrovibrio sp.]
MQTDNRLLDDLSRIAAGALGTLQGVKGEVEQAFRQRLERALADMDLVSREEFETVRAMAQAAREENIRLSERLAALESKLNRGFADEA